MAERRVRYYPAFLNLEGRRAVVVGGGEVAARKIDSLLGSGATVIVIAPTATDAVDGLSAAGRIELRRKRYDRTDITDAAIVIAATSDAAVNAQVASDAKGAGILVNVVDDPTLCDFIVPASIESGPIQLAVSTGAQSPALARKLRQDLERLVGAEYAEMGEILGNVREPAKRSLSTDAERKRFFDRLIASGIVEMLREGRRRDAYETAVRLCEEAGVPVPEAMREKISS